MNNPYCILACFCLGLLINTCNIILQYSTPPIYKYIYEYKYLYICCTGNWTCFFFILFYFLMWNLKESSSYCGFTWGIVIQWPCCYLNQKWGNERTCSVIFLKADGTKCLKLVLSLTLWVQQVRSSNRVCHFNAPGDTLNCKVGPGWGTWGENASPV